KWLCHPRRKAPAPKRRTSTMNGLILVIANAIAPSSFAQVAKQADAWVHVTEDDLGIKIETDRLEAVIPKKKNKQWMTGIEKQSFLDKATGFREAGDGL